MSRHAAQLVHGWSREHNIALSELRPKIAAAVRAATPPESKDDRQLDAEVVITADEDAQRQELFAELQAMEGEHALEDGLPELKEAARSPAARQ